MADTKPEAQAVSTTADTTDKRRNLARQLIQTATQLMAAVDIGYDQTGEYNAAGLTFLDTDFQGQPGLSHVDATMMTNALSQFVNVHDWMKSGFIDSVFYALKP